MFAFRLIAIGIGLVISGVLAILIGPELLTTPFMLHLDEPYRVFVFTLLFLGSGLTVTAISYLAVIAVIEVICLLTVGTTLSSGFVLKWLFENFRSKQQN